MQLPEDLVERIEAMAARQHLRFHSMIYALLCSGVDGHAKPAKRLQIVPPAVPPIDL
jgi:hypothetical protein